MLLNAELHSSGPALLNAEPHSSGPALLNAEPRFSSSRPGTPQRRTSLLLFAARRSSTPSRTPPARRSSTPSRTPPARHSSTPNLASPLRGPALLNVEPYSSGCPSEELSALFANNSAHRTAACNAFARPLPQFAGRESFRLPFPGVDGCECAFPTAAGAMAATVIFPLPYRHLTD